MKHRNTKILWHRIIAKTKARFGCLWRLAAWKQRMPVLTAPGAYMCPIQAPSYEPIQSHKQHQPYTHWSAARPSVTLPPAQYHHLWTVSNYHASNMTMLRTNGWGQEEHLAYKNFHHSFIWFSFLPVKKENQMASQPNQNLPQNCN